jgi:formate hydrogenlyase transcriptional activator
LFMSSRSSNAHLKPRSLRSEAKRATNKPRDGGDGREVIDALPVIVWRADPHTFQFTFVSQYAQMFLGYPLQLWIEPSFWNERVYPEDKEWVVARRTRAVEQGGDYDVEYRLVTNDVRALWVRELGRVLTPDSGGGLAGIIIDLSEKRSAQQALGDSKRWLRQVIDSIPVEIWSGPADGTLDFCNARWRDELGLSLKELQGDGWQRMLHPGDRDRVLKAWHDSVANGTPYEQQERHRMADGQYRWFLCRGTALHDEGGKIVRWFGSNTDIDRPKKAEDELKRLGNQLQQERDRLRLLLDLNHRFAAKLDVREFFDALLDGLRRHAGWPWATILLPEPASHGLKVFLSPDNAYLREGETLPIDGSLQGEVYRSGKPVAFHIEDLPALCQVYRKDQWRHDVVRAEGIQAGCSLPLLHEGTVIGVLFLMTRVAQDLTKGDLNFFQELATLVAARLHNTLRFQSVNESHARLVSECKYIEADLLRERGFADIIGNSPGMLEVLRQISTVAPTDSTVLITGETGTGKELIARTIHERSPRHDHSFIKVDCAAIPATLMESELFGHEKGAFTGATSQRLGRVELADHGTLFLDEVGDIPLELQSKLLRLVQDRAFERLGSNRTRSVDVRIISATHRNLETLVEQGKFREDLYYRLKVFPIAIPPLRHRSSDIPSLVKYYVAKYTRRMKKQVPSIPQSAMEVFLKYPWPGNVRELQHFIERSIVLTSGPQLQAPLSELQEIIQRRASGRATKPTRPLEDIERETILQALEQSNWVVGGPHGAAAKLGLKRTTLASRIERLGICR